MNHAGYAFTRKNKTAENEQPVRTRRFDALAGLAWLGSSARVWHSHHHLNRSVGIL